MTTLEQDKYPHYYSQSVDTEGDGNKNPETNTKPEAENNIHQEKDGTLTLLINTEEIKTQSCNLSFALEVPELAFKCTP